MSGIYLFLLHVVHVLLSAFHPSPVAAVRVAGHTVPGRHVVQAAMRAPDTGYWHTAGNLILDRQNRQIRIQGINWYGFETVREVAGGLDRQDYKAILRMIRDQGFNTVRIPFSNQMIESPAVPSAISFQNGSGPINTDLRGMNSLGILDRIVAAAGELGLKIILDNHRSEAGDSAEASGLWYTDEYSEAIWVADWQRLARRYDGNSTVIGFDLRNEPHNATTGGACWDCGGDRDWHLAAERAGNAVLGINPRLLVFVEGVDAYNNDFAWWGGNLEGVRRSPVRLEIPGQLVYSAHSYGPAEYRQKWFNASSTPASLETVEYRHWAFISFGRIAPVWLGEFGTTNNTEDIRSDEPGSEGQWFQTMVGFLGKHPELNWTSWALNGEDANGLLDPAYNLTPANPLKMQLLARIETPTTPPPAAPSRPAVQQAISTPAPYTPAFAPVYRPDFFQPSSPTVPSTSGVCRVIYSSRNDTGRETTDVMEIDNLSGQTINGWMLQWRYGGSKQVEQVRNGRFVQDGNTVILANTGVNSSIPPGGRLAGIVLQTSYRGANTRPAQFYLNGSLCS